jgi:hypothetical protein
MRRGGAKVRRYKRKSNLLRRTKTVFIALGSGFSDLARHPHFLFKAFSVKNSACRSTG